MSATDVMFFLSVRSSLKLYHWTSTIYSRHKATDKAIEKLDDLIDEFIEVYIGTTGKRPLLSASLSDANLRVRNLSDEDSVLYVRRCIEHTQHHIDTSASPDLVHIRDEILSVFHRLLYLFSFH